MASDSLASSKPTKRKREATIETNTPATLEDEKKRSTDEQEKNTKSIAPLGGENVSYEAGKSSILSDIKFSDFTEINEKIQAALKDIGYEYMTQIQAYTIPKMMIGRDVLGAAKTGSGKTLAFVIPALDLLWKTRATPRMGTIVLILAPTRELVLQISEVVRETGKNVTHTFGVVIGGANRKEEKKKLISGVNLLAATPGRLLDHMENTPEFVYRNLALLIMDEADRMLEVGFEKELTKIIRMLPDERQTALFSATQTSKVADLIRLSLKKPLLVEVKDSIATVEGLHQLYIMCESGARLSLLYRILREKVKNGVPMESSDGKTMTTRVPKIMVFFSSCQSTQYHEDLFRLFNEMHVVSLHGKKKQMKRIEVYNQFCKAQSGILFCTNIAARGLDFPGVDFIVQYDPPDDVREYIHRVGRTARGEGGKGSSILFLLPEETKLLEALANAGVRPKKAVAQLNTLDRIQTQLETIINKTPDLKALAIDAFGKFLLAYNSHGMKDIFDVNKLDLTGVAKSFALDSIPRVDLPNIKSLCSNRKRMKKH